MMPEPSDRSQSRAILIGTSVYQDPAYPPVPAAANSLKGFRDLLVDPRLCRWPTDRITFLQDALDARRVVQQLRRLAEDTEDVLLLYFVGHGTLLPGGQLCLALADTDATDPDLTGVEYDRIRDILLRSPARVKITVLDCCHSGRAIEALSPLESIADVTDTAGVYTLTASDYLAHVPPLERQAGAYTSFTGELIKIVRAGIPGEEEELTLNTIYRRLRLSLRNARLPAPNQRGTDTADQFAFSHNAAWIPGSLDLWLRYTLDIVFCVDTGIDMEPSLPAVKELMLGICRRVTATMGKSRPVIRQRVKVITFSQTGQEATPFFSFPEQAYECETFVSGLAASGQSSPLAGLMAFREAMHSDWERGSAARHVQVIVVFASHANLPKAVPEELYDELLEDWGYQTSLRGLMDPVGKRLCLLAPDQPPWNRIAGDFANTIFSGIDPGSRMSEYEIDDLLGVVAYEI